MKLIKTLAIAIAAISTAALQTSCETQAQEGALIGGLGGAAVGAAVAGDGNRAEGAAIGGAVGALGGAAVGRSKDRKDYEQYRRDQQYRDQRGYGYGY